MSSNILAPKDVNAAIVEQATAGAGAGMKPDVKSMDYHRQVLAGKMAEQKTSYISPSDDIMSPCTAKLSAYRSNQITKGVKPRSLFAKTSAKSLASTTNTKTASLFGESGKEGEGK